MKLRGLPIVSLAALSLLVFTPHILAAFSFTNLEANPTTINSLDQEVQLNVTFSDFPTNSYLRPSFQRAVSGGSYFGYVKNSSNDWVKVQPLSSTDCSDAFQITDNSTTSASFTLKVGPDSIPQGPYQVKINRLSSSCNSSGDAISLPVEILLPTPSPSPDPTPTDIPPSPTPEVTPTPEPTINPSPTLEPTPSSTPEPSPTPTPEPTPTLNPSTTVIPPTPEPTTPEPSPTIAPTPTPTIEVPPSQTITTPILSCTISYRPVKLFGLTFYFPKLFCSK